MVINTNVAAQTSASNLMASQNLLGKSLARLSSGSKIVDPSDDAAGLAVANRMNAKINRIDAAKSSLANAISFNQTQDGYLKKISKALDRMSELSILAQDVTKTDSDRSLYNAEYQELTAFVTSSANKDFNGVSLFSANAMQVLTDGEGNTFTMNGIDMTAAAYSSATSGNISTTTAAAAALSTTKAAITQLATDRATIGAYLTRMNTVSEQLVVSKENLTSAVSRIMDVNVAEESTRFAKHNILVQSGTAMLSQANQLPQSVLRLLQ